MHYAIGGLGQQCGSGSDPHEAILTSSLSRFQSILITTVTTILGMSPLIISKDPLFYTLGLIVAIGLAFGTMLTLGVVPVLYVTFFRCKYPDNRANRAARIKKRKS